MLVGFSTSAVFQNSPCIPAQLAGVSAAFLCTHEEQIKNTPCFFKYYPNVTGRILGICVSGTSGTVLYVCLISAGLHLCSIPWSQVNSNTLYQRLFLFTSLTKIAGLCLTELTLLRRKESCGTMWASNLL